MNSSICFIGCCHQNDAQNFLFLKDKKPLYLRLDTNIGWIDKGIDATISVNICETHASINCKYLINVRCKVTKNEH